MISVHWMRQYKTFALHADFTALSPQHHRVVLSVFHDLRLSLSPNPSQCPQMEKAALGVYLVRQYHPTGSQNPPCDATAQCLLMSSHCPQP